MYFLAVILVLIFLITATVYLLTGIISIVNHAPYVPTSLDALKEMLKAANPKKGQAFIDLGAGDGRAVEIANEEFKMNASGYEVNPMLCILAKLRYGIKLHNKNMFEADISDSDIIFVYLFPRLLKKLAPKLNKECKEGTIIISYTFKIKGLEDKLYKTIEVENNRVYYYRM